MKASYIAYIASSILLLSFYTFLLPDIENWILSSHIIFVSLLYLLCSIWFYFNTRDWYISIFNFFFSLFSILYFVQSLNPKFTFLWQIQSLFLLSFFLNMGLRTSGQYISTRLLITETILVLFLSLLTFVGKENEEILHNINKLLYVITFFVFISILFFQLKKIKRKNDPIDFYKSISLFFGTLISFFIPLLIIGFTYYFDVKYEMEKYIFFFFLFFPPALIYGTYRLQLTPFQFLFPKSIVVLLQSLFFSCIYILAVILDYFLLPPELSREYKWVLDAIFILSLIIFLDPLQYTFTRYISKKQFWKNQKFENSLNNITSLIISQRSIKTAIEASLDEVKKTLNLQKVDILLSEDAFYGFRLRNNEVLRIPNNDIFWKYLPEYKFLVTNYLTYAGGAREKLFRFLFVNNYMIAFSVKNSTINSLQNFFSMILPFLEKTKKQNLDTIKVALLIGYSKAYKNLSINETRYLYEVARLVNILVRNYSILLDEIQKRYQIRELQIAGQLQRKLPQIDNKKFKDISFSYFSKAAVSVSGDYFDIIEAKNSLIACFLADVSGHGLGTGYLASSLQAMIRSHLKSGASLQDVIQIVNDFFMQRYHGDEFLTMTAFLFNKKEQKLEYSNAAHPPPFLFSSKDSSKLKLLHSFQPVLGVLPVEYKTKKIVLENNDRLLLYSDGVTETFDQNNMPFGDKRLEAFIKKNHKLNLHEFIRKLRDHLLNHRGEVPASDDVTFAVLEYNKEDKLKSLFSKIKNKMSNVLLN